MKHFVEVIVSRREFSLMSRWEIYLAVVGDWHRDAILIGDIVGAVIRGAWARAGGAATCRVWATQIKHVLKEYKDSVKNRTVWTQRVCGSPTCHIKGAFLSCGDGAVSTTKQRTAPPLAHLLLQPGAELQVGFRGWIEDRRTRVNIASLIIYSPSVMEFPNRPKMYLLLDSQNIKGSSYVHSLLEIIFNILHLVFFF